MEHTQSPHLSARKRTLIFVNLVVSGIATSILSTAMTTALPDVMEYFGVSTSIGQWVTSGYSLAMGMVMPLTAFLITRFPTKRLYMAGIACFLVGISQHLEQKLRSYDDRPNFAGLQQRRITSHKNK